MINQKTELDLISNSSKEDKIHNHYPGLDGLRTIAVIMVFFQHYGAGKALIFGWGWIGVDVFFVLSGFLITGILYDSRHKADKYLNFYMRRTIRIFPLYYFLWVLFVLLIPIAKWEWDWRWLSWPAYIGNYAGFTLVQPGENIYEFTRITLGTNVTKFFGYPMHVYIGHFWSLCVEEQFYLIWPLIVYKIANRKILINICVAIIVTMPFIRWIIILNAPAKLIGLELLYRSMPTRVDALLIGGFAALVIRGMGKDLIFKWRYAMIILTILILVVADWLFTNQFKMPYTGSVTNWVSIFGYTLIDICALGILLETIKPGTWLEKILSVKVLRNFGIITYGFYIYHDLLHDGYGYLAARFFPNHLFIATLIIAFFSTWIIAYTSYKFLESPLLKFKRYFNNQIHKAPSMK